MATRQVLKFNPD